ncbi:TRAP transporter solute receptor, TAXI family [Rhodopseudomonas palustris HaA2]|uniref:TRAP transporter solute receptor, TAXI family n=1 Tax=Rhodopseudomonas palustris (strain HaA2) TaxID=316058 RepID=Q2J3Z8_RHOP2|nr:TRAP transporter solute receptor, TAXI family [Rhodopseudomonas palustris HaA2]
MDFKRLFARSMDEPEPVDPLLHMSARPVRRKTTLISLAAILALVGAISAAYYFAMRPTTLKIAVGPQASDDLRLIQALAQAFSRERNIVRMRPIVTDGPAASAAALKSDTTDLAVIRGDLPVPRNARSVAVLHKNVAVLWAPGRPASGKRRKAAVAGVTTITQLVGKRVGVIGRTEANAGLLAVILRQYGIDPAKVESVQLTAADVAEAVRTGKADAFLAAGPLNSKVIGEALAATASSGREPVFLGIDSSEALAANHPSYESASIPAGAFGGAPARPGDDVKTISFSHYIVARDGVSDATIASFTQQLFTARQTVMTENPLAAKIETPDTDKDAVIPVQAGAAAYVDGEQRSFLDRYSDLIWFSLMGLSATGSLGAWFASYLRKDERNTNASQRDRLLDMLAAARRCDAQDELDAMQTEADAILRDALNCYENGAIDSAALTAFSIALEQFHNAVVDRKMLLAAIPPAPPIRPARPQVV